MRILILTGQHKYSINLAREVAKIMNYRKILSIEEFASLKFGERNFIKSIDSTKLRSLFNAVESKFINRVVIANGVIRYILLKLHYNRSILNSEYRLLREVYSTYDYVVYIIPKITKSANLELFKGFKEDFTGVALVSLGNIDPKKIILDYNVNKNMKKRARRIAEIIARKSNEVSYGRK